MEKILLKRRENGATVISNYFIDNYMVKASGEYVKVYLYLLRCLSDTEIQLSIGGMAEALEHTENDILRALKYWAGQEVLTIEYGTGPSDIVSIEINDMPPVEVKMQKNHTVADKEQEIRLAAPVKKTEKLNTYADERNLKAVEKKKETTDEDKLLNVMSDPDVKMILYIVQKYLGKTLSSSETQTILYFYTELEFSSELIEYLVEYCVSNNHKSMKYIEKVALNWHSQGVTTVEEAKQYTSSFANSCYPVLNAFGLTGRNPAATEKAFVVKWTDEYGFDMDIIVDACNRTIDAIHKPSFQYADSILQRWKKRGITSVEELQEIDEEHERQKEAKAAQNTKRIVAPGGSFNNFRQRSYDYDAIEKMLLQKQ